MDYKETYEKTSEMFEDLMASSLPMDPTWFSGFVSCLVMLGHLDEFYAKKLMIFVIAKFEQMREERTIH